MLDNDLSLVVGASFTVRKAICSVLREHLHCQHFIDAENGMTALALLRKNPKISWVFSDWDMPIMNGDALLSEIRRDHALAHLPFIMVTPRSDRDSLAVAVQLGVSAYVVRPFRAKTLVDKVLSIRGHLERRSADRVRIGRLERSVQVQIDPYETQTASLLDISLSGLLVQVSLAPLRGLSVFDTGFVTVDTEGLSLPPLALPVQLIRAEADADHPLQTEYIHLAFRFQAMSREVQSGLFLLLERLRRECASHVETRHVTNEAPATNTAAATDDDEVVLPPDEEA